MRVRPLMMVLVPLCRKTREPLLSLRCVVTAGRLAICTIGGILSLEPEHAGTCADLTLAASRRMRKSFLLLKPQNLWYLTLAFQTD